MYSDDLIVRKYKLNDLCNIDDLSKVIGYKSYNSFKNWEFYKSSKSLFGSTTDALSDIVSLYRIQYNFLDDIYLTAVYEKNDDILPEDSKIVMHAAGGLNGKTYLDCLEAFEYWYAKGQRFFEFDFGITTDGYIVACHFVFDKTLEQIRKDMKGYTVLLLDDIIDLIDKYEDIIIDFDVLTIYELSHSNHVINYIKFYTELENSIKSKNNQKIYEQIILEILPNTSCEMFSLAKKYTNLKKFLYAEYNGSTTPINNKDDFENVLKWCNENGVQYLSIDNFNYEYGRLASKYNIKCFTFTYDNIEKIYEFLDMGCSGVFSNWIFI